MKEDKARTRSELYVTAAVIIPWILQQLGIDIGQYITPTSEMTMLANSITEQAATNNMPVYIAGLYVIGRMVKKWRMIDA